MGNPINQSPGNGQTVGDKLRNVHAKTMQKIKSLRQRQADLCRRMSSRADELAMKEASDALKSLGEDKENDK